MKSFLQYITHLYEATTRSKARKEANNLSNLKIRRDALSRGGKTWVKNDSLERVDKAIKQAEHGVKLYGGNTDD